MKHAKDGPRDLPTAKRYRDIFMKNHWISERDTYDNPMGDHAYN